MPKKTTVKAKKIVAKKIEKKPIKKIVRKPEKKIYEAIEVMPRAPKFGVTNVIAIIILIALLGLAGFYASKNAKSAVDNNSIQNVEAQQAFNYDCDEGKTALASLQEKAQIETQDSTVGIWVQSINGTSNNEDHFWMFYVNGELSQTAPEQYTCKVGDKIEWRYEKFTF